MYLIKQVQHSFGKKEVSHHKWLFKQLYLPAYQANRYNSKAIGRFKLDN